MNLFRYSVSEDPLNFVQKSWVSLDNPAKHFVFSIYSLTEKVIDSDSEIVS